MVMNASTTTMTSSEVQRLIASTTNPSRMKRAKRAATKSTGRLRLTRFVSQRWVRAADAYFPQHWMGCTGAYGRSCDFLPLCDSMYADPSISLQLLNPEVGQYRQVIEVTKLTDTVRLVEADQEGDIE